MGGWLVSSAAAACIVAALAWLLVVRAHQNAHVASAPVPQEQASSDSAAPSEDWEQINAPKLAELQRQASRLAASGDLPNASAKYRQFMTLAGAAPHPSATLQRQVAAARRALEALSLKAAPFAASSQPVASDAAFNTAPPTSAPAVAVAPQHDWEQLNRGRIRQLLQQAQAKLGRDDKLGAALSYRQLFELVGAHAGEIRDGKLKQQLAEAARANGRLAVQLKSSPQAVSLTAATLLTSGIEAERQQHWQAALESLSDVRQLFDRSFKTVDRVKDPNYLAGLHALAVAYLHTKQVPKAGELFAESTPLSKQIEHNPTRPLVINRAVTDIIQRTMAVRAAKTLKEYLDKHPQEADEQMLNLLGTAIAVGQEHAGSKSFLNQLGAYYAQLNEKLEQTRPGEKRWGVQWLPSTDVDLKMAERKQAIGESTKLTAMSNAAYNEWQRLIQLSATRNTRGQRMASDQEVAAAEGRYQQLAAQADAASKRIPPIPWLTEVEPVLPVADQRPSETAVAMAHENDSTSTMPPPIESSSTSLEQSTGSSTEDTSGPSAEPTHTAPIPVQRFALAFAIDKSRLVTAANVIGTVGEVRLTGARGIPLTARVVAKGERLALLEVDASQIEGGALRYFNVASDFGGGPVRCACIPQENIFVPEPKLLKGEATAPPPQGEWFASLSDHPRLPGSPLLDAQGQVVGVVLPTSRDDPHTHLPAVTPAQLREFLTAQSALASQPSRNPDPTAVYEVAVEER